MSGDLRRSGVDALGDVPWGTHLCQFHQTRQDFWEVLVGYLRQGLDDNEFCLWVTADPQGTAEAFRTLAQMVPHWDERVDRAQIEIVDYQNWYLSRGRFEQERVLQGWLEKERDALARGYAGLRVAADLSWLHDTHWADFTRYEGTVCDVLGGHRILALCMYDLDQCSGERMLGILRNHPLALIKSQDRWEVVQSPHQRKLQESLRESEMRLRSVIETSPDAIALLALDGRLLMVNQRAAALAGFRTGAEMLASGINGFDLVAPDERSRASDNVRRLLDVGILTNVEYTAIRQDGNRFPSEVSASLLRGDEAEPYAMVVVMRDITERKQAEELLRKSEDRYRSLFSGMTEGFALHEIICDEHGNPCDYRFLELNPAFEVLTGLAREKVIGKTLREILPNETSPWIEIYGSVALTGQPARFHSHSVALERHYEVFAYCPAPRQFAVLFTDITQRLAAEAERRQLDAQIQHTQKLESLGILAGGIAHDFNNILAGIMGYADLALRRLGDDNPVRDDIGEIKRASERAAGLTRQMLAYSGRGWFIVEPVNLSLIVEDCRSILAMSVSKKTVLSYRLAPHLPAIQADASQVCQVVMNLVINGSEALSDQDGEVVISTYTRQFTARELSTASVRSDLGEGRFVCLEITDTGCGMDESTLTRIFEPFFTTKFTGRGLGLAAVHGIVRGHQGFIRVVSVRGKGTSFQVLFPASDDVAPVIAKELTPATSRKGHGIVLVVDDEEVVRGVAKSMLESMGYAALTASSGEQAVRLYRQHQSEVACVLLDLAMPMMDGRETLAALQEICPKVRVILSSGYSEEGATAGFSRAELAGFIQKPYTLAALTTLLHRVVGDRSDAHSASCVAGMASANSHVRDGARASVKVNTTSVKPANRTGTVLVVDDDEMVRTSTRITFELAGFTVVTAVDGVEALCRYREHQDRIVCVYLDLMMPRMNGDETLRELRRMNSAVRVILASGGDERELTHRFAGHGVWEFHYKSKPLNDLIAKLHSVLANPAGAHQGILEGASDCCPQ